MQPEKRVLSVREAAHLLGISEWNVRNLCTERKLRSVRAGKRVLIPREEIERFLDDGGHQE